MLCYSRSHFPRVFSSNTWRSNFFKRHKFSTKKLTKKFNVKGTSEIKMNDIANFHISMRALQLSSTRDPTFGFTSPYYVFSHDQVPIELADGKGKSVHDTGDDMVYDGFGKETDVKRFCTLNLFGAMDYRDDGLNIPKPHVVFNGTFKPGSEWHDEEEREQWDKRVYVSFQENAWVDARTHILGLKAVLGGDINELLKTEKMIGVTLEDNLGSHKTKEVMHTWDNCPLLSEFIRPRFVPPNLTDIVQVRRTNVIVL